MLVCAWMNTHTCGPVIQHLEGALISSRSTFVRSPGGHAEALALPQPGEPGLMGSGGGQGVRLLPDPLVCVCLPTS